MDLQPDDGLVFHGCSSSENDISSITTKLGGGKERGDIDRPICLIDCADNSPLQWSCTVKTFIAMVEGVREQAIKQGLIGLDEWERGIRELYRSADADGTFCYTFFKATGYRL
jgi:hypothetical protein